MPVKHGAIANPIFALLMEGLAFLILVAFFNKNRWQKKSARALLGGGTALIAISLVSELGKNIPLALATIIETKGSTPQVQGASAIFSLEGLIKGTLGGGILEADALKKALNAIQKKISHLYEFDLHADISSDEGAICGGKAVILIDTCQEKNMNIFSDIEKSMGRYQPGVLATFIGRYPDEKISIARHWIEKNEIPGPGLKAKLSRYMEEIKKCLDENNTLYLEIEKKSYFENAPETFLFLEPLFPLPVLIIAGAGHIGQAVSHLGSLLEFEVTVIDDRPEYSNREKIPDADHIIVDDIGKAIRKIPKTPDTYIVIVTRGHKNDVDALRQSEKGIVIAVYNGKRGHPILFEMKYRSEVEQLVSGSSLRDLTQKHSEDILEVGIDDPRILRDIDTMNDYNKELKYRRLS